MGTTPVEMGIPKFERRPGDATGAESRTDFRWLMSSDMCKRRTHAKCLDVCPTGALFRTELALSLCSKTFAMDAAIACRPARMG